MSTLLVVLPQTLAGPATLYDYVLTHDGLQSEGHGSALANDLPRDARAGGEIIAVVPAEALSWHRVTLPQGITGKSPRLRAVLEGLLEEHLLDEPDNMHFAIQSGTHSAAPVWVAACDKAWLRAAVQSLELADRPVDRIVPECSPAEEAPTWQVVGGQEGVRLTIATQHGVATLPFEPATVALANETGATAAEARIFAEPGVVELAEKVLGRRVRLERPDERYLKAMQSPWDLAQADMANSPRHRSWKRIGERSGALLLGRNWRAVRWGLTLMVILNIAGLNALAWKEQSSLNHKRQALRDTLAQTFPKVGPIVDAPLQMQRQLALLKQSAGVASARDLEPMLEALGAAVPAKRSISAMDFSTSEARIKGLNLSDAQAVQLINNLKVHGYSAQNDGTDLVVKESSGL